MLSLFYHPRSGLLLHLMLMHLMGEDFVSTAKPDNDSCSVYHWATGFRGLSSISIQWSRPSPIQLLPMAQQPITSLAPTLTEKTLEVNIHTSHNPLWEIKALIHKKSKLFVKWTNMWIKQHYILPDYAKFLGRTG